MKVVANIADTITTISRRYVSKCINKSLSTSHNECLGECALVAVINLGGTVGSCQICPTIAISISCSPEDGRHETSDGLDRFSRAFNFEHVIRCARL